MSGHTPTILEMTAAPDRPELVARRVLDTLTDSYLARLRRVRSRRSADTGPDGGPILLDAIEVFIQVTFLPDPGSGTHVCPVIELSSEAYESVYDVLRKRTIRAGRRALIDFCVAVAASAKVDGFRLRHHDSDASALSMPDLVRDLTSVDRSAGLISGISNASPSLPAVRRYWPRWKETNGYALLVFI